MKQNSKTIRVSADTLERLGKRRNGFETPDECINRILSNKPCNEDEDEDVVEENGE